MNFLIENYPKNSREKNNQRLRIFPGELLHQNQQKLENHGSRSTLRTKYQWKDKIVSITLLLMDRSGRKNDSIQQLLK